MDRDRDAQRGRSSESPPSVGVWPDGYGRQQKAPGWGGTVLQLGRIVPAHGPVRGLTSHGRTLLGGAGAAAERMSTPSHRGAKSSPPGVCLA